MNAKSGVIKEGDYILYPKGRLRKVLYVQENSVRINNLYSTPSRDPYTVVRISDLVIYGCMRVGASEGQALAHSLGTTLCRMDHPLRPEFEKLMTKSVRIIRKCKHVFSESDVKYIIKNYGAIPDDLISQRIGCAVDELQKYCRYNKIYKSDEVRNRYYLSSSDKFYIRGHIGIRSDEYIIKMVNAKSHLVERYMRSLRGERKKLSVVPSPQDSV